MTQKMRSQVLLGLLLLQVECQLAEELLRQEVQAQQSALSAECRTQMLQLQASLDAQESKLQSELLDTRQVALRQAEALAVQVRASCSYCN